MANPVAAVKSGASSFFGGFRRHPVTFFLLGAVLSAFVYPMVFRKLGELKAKGGTLGKIIPTFMTR